MCKPASRGDIGKDAEDVPMASRRLRCRECGEPYDYDRATGNPYFCPECDDARRRRVSRSLAEITSRFEEKETRYGEGA